MSHTSELEAIIKMVNDAVAEEREACAKVAEEFAENHEFFDSGYDVGRKTAAAIRARGKQETMPV